MVEGQEIKEYLTTGEAAGRLKYTSRHVRNLLNSGALKGIQMPSGVWRVTTGEVERFLRELDSSNPVNSNSALGAGIRPPSPDSGTAKALDLHVTEIRWLATQVLNQTRWDLMQLAGENPDDVHRHLAAAAGGTSESGPLINTRSRPASVSLVVEKHPSFPLLTDHLSSVVPLGEAPDTWDNAVTKVYGLAQESDPDYFDSEAAARVDRMLVPVSSFWYSLGALKTELAQAADIVLAVTEDLLQLLRDQGERLIDPEKMASVEGEILPRFTDISVAKVCGGLFPPCDAGQIRNGRYDLGARNHPVLGESLIELLWHTPQDRICTLAISPSRHRIDELRRLHQSQQVASEAHPGMVKLVRSLKQADLFERRIRDAVESALATRDFPGRCQQCPSPAVTPVSE